ncbi:hypothetical protein [Rathayibacter rathayi]|uniref:hypothetical protein n=1 Tax=Rathayibacter rathayi TaxID=33887 RepID=UPI0015E3C728|nr:hypothetical protein [Rathayibacter rathayi]
MTILDSLLRRLPFHAPAPETPADFTDDLLDPSGLSPCGIRDRHRTVDSGSVQRDRL